MSTILSAPTAPGESPSWSGRLIRALRCRLVDLLTWHRQQRVLAELRMMSTRQLEDIGITRSQIELATRRAIERDRPSGRRS